ncbi:hypothetical protein D9M68_736160 [compost metagenome]
MLHHDANSIALPGQVALPFYVVFNVGVVGWQHPHEVSVQLQSTKLHYKESGRQHAEYNNQHSIIKKYALNP